MRVSVKAQAVRRILAKRNLSQNWLAQQVGTNSGYMSQLMTGIRNPSPKMREKFLKVFKGYHFEDLFTLRWKKSGRTSGDSGAED